MSKLEIGKSNNQQAYLYWLDILTLKESLIDGKYLRFSNRELTTFGGKNTVLAQDVLSKEDYKNCYEGNEVPVSPHLLRFSLETIRKGFQEVSMLKIIEFSSNLKNYKEEVNWSEEVYIILTELLWDFEALAVFYVYDKSRNYEKELEEPKMTHEESLDYYKKFGTMSVEEIISYMENKPKHLLADEIREYQNKLREEFSLQFQSQVEVVIEEITGNSQSSTSDKHIKSDKNINFKIGIFCIFLGLILMQFFPGIVILYLWLYFLGIYFFLKKG